MIFFQLLVVGIFFCCTITFIEWYWSYNHVLNWYHSRIRQKHFTIILQYNLLDNINIKCFSSSVKLDGKSKLLTCFPKYKHLLLLIQYLIYHPNNLTTLNTWDQSTFLYMSWYIFWPMNSNWKFLRMKTSFYVLVFNVL